MLFEDSLPAVYDEIDYNLVDGYWLIARVQSYEPPPSSLFGGKLRVVFACGVQELVHELDLSRPEDVKRIAPVGTFSIPFVAKQPVDVLVRTPKSSIGGALEQWQKGEIVHTGTNISCDAGGAHCRVEVKIVSEGNAVLGSTAYPAEYSRTNDLSLITDGQVIPYVPTVFKAPQTVLIPPYCVASPDSNLAKWTPSQADIAEVTPQTLHAQFRQFSNRNSLNLSTGEQAVNRCSTLGRQVAQAFDTIDFTLHHGHTLFSPPSTSGNYGSARSASDSHARRPNFPLFQRLRAVYGKTLGHVGSELIPRGGSSLLFTKSRAQTFGKGIVPSSAHPPAKVAYTSSMTSNPLNSILKPPGSPARGSITPPTSPSIPRSPPRSPLLSPTSSPFAPGSKNNAATITSIALPARFRHPNIRTGRIVCLRDDEADLLVRTALERTLGKKSNACPVCNHNLSLVASFPCSAGSASSSLSSLQSSSPHAAHGFPSTASLSSASGGSDSTTRMHLGTARNRESVRLDGVTIGPSASTAPLNTYTMSNQPPPPETGRLYVVWFEPTLSSSGKILQTLQAATLTSLATVAPAGVLSCPLLPGQIVDYRRPGGAWGRAVVLSSDRFAIRLRGSARTAQELFCLPTPVLRHIPCDPPTAVTISPPLAQQTGHALHARRGSIFDRFTAERATSSAMAPSGAPTGHSRRGSIFDRFTSSSLSSMQGNALAAAATASAPGPKTIIPNGYRSLEQEPSAPQDRNAANKPQKTVKQEGWTPIAPTGAWSIVSPKEIDTFPVQLWGLCIARKGTFVDDHEESAKKAELFAVHIRTHQDNPTREDSSLTEM